ncbi:MAG: 5'-nucleotidase [Gammaproteobacteria bacterium]|nr:5'-nucleotidase [Gammaproteobacteria bacterium]
MSFRHAPAISSSCRGKTLTQEKFVFGVDLDGVVADFIAGLRPIAAEWLGMEVASLPLEVSYGFPEWRLDRYGGYEALHRFAVKERDLFKRLPPIAGAPAALRRLSGRDVRIRIITHRLYIKWFHQEAVQQTVDWLEYHGIPYWDLCFMRDKAAVGADLYVEDSPANIRALRDTGHEVLVLRNSTNRDLPGPGADSWAEVEAFVEARVRSA